MLEMLRIRNFILIDEEEISFSEGLNVFTGETGAGKSLVLQALSLILGARPKPGLIKKGAEKWEIEAVFDLHSIRNRQVLPDIVTEEDDQLILYRSSGSSGRSKVLINGRLATVGMLEEIARSLIHICGQGAFVSLLDSKTHLHMLDSYAELSADLQEYGAVYQEYITKKKLLAERQHIKENSALRRAELEYLVAEIGAVAIEAGIRERLELEIEALSNAESRIVTAATIEEGITADGALLDQMNVLEGRLESLQDKNASIVEAAQIAGTISAELGELSVIISRYIHSIETDDSTLESLRVHLSEIARLERKFHMSDRELADLLDRSRSELDELDCEESLEQLEKECASLYEQVAVVAAALTKKRKKSSLSLAKIVNAELKDLNMPDARLSVTFKPCELNSGGNASVEFEMITNKGQDPGPLKQIASGGELSRILLVLKKVLRDQTGVNVLVFDEVDAGVSGKVARAVGEKLKSLASNSQVLCITHLAQVASLADAHFVVRKQSDSAVQTTVDRISDDMVVDEIARMLAGYQITETSRASARELLAS